MLERKTFHVISEEIVRSDVPPTTMDIPRTIYIYSIRGKPHGLIIDQFIASNFFLLVSIINISFSSKSTRLFFSSFRWAKSSQMHIFLPVFTINRKTFLAPGAHVESKIALRVLNCNPILLVSVDKPNLSRLRFNLPTNSHLEACWTHFCNTFRCFNLRSCNLPRSSVIWKLLSFLDPVTGTRYYHDFRFLDRWIFSQSFYLTWKARKRGIVTNKNCYRYIHMYFFYAKISTWFHFNPPRTEATRDRSRRILVSLVALYSFKS